MNSIAVIDSVAGVLFIAAFLCAARIPATVLDRRSRGLMMAGVGIYVFVCLSNILEHSGITTALDYFEDYAEIMFLPVFLVFIYSVMIQRETIRRERGERALQQSESRLRSLLSALPDMIFRIDREGTFVDFKPGKEFDPVVPPEEFIGRELGSFFPESFVAQALGKVREALRTGEMQVYEYQLQGDGGPQEYEARMVASGADEVTAVVRDVTEEKKSAASLLQVKENLEKQNAELKKIDRVKDSLLRDVSHELKTPVAKHAMQLEVLKPIIAKHRLTEEEARALATMEENIKRQQSVIRNLLNLSRLEEGGRAYLREPMVLDDVIHRVLGDYRDLADRYGVEVAVDVPPVAMSSDAEMLWHLFSNLVSNALKFRTRSGRPLVRITAEAGEKTVTVSVSDNGIGLSDVEQERIFESFFQGTASAEGSGVGLTICHMIVQGLGGSITLKSGGRNMGTTAVVTLPAD